MTGRTVVVSGQSIVGHLDPVVRDLEPLSHDAPVGAMKTEGHLDVLGSVAGDESEDVAELVHRLGDDALVLFPCVEVKESASRHDRSETEACESDAEFDIVVVEVVPRDQNIVVRLRLLPWFVVKKREELAAVDLAVIVARALSFLNVPVDAVPGDETIHDSPVLLAPYAEISHFDMVFNACGFKHRARAVDDGLHMGRLDIAVVHDVDGA